MIPSGSTAPAHPSVVLVGVDFGLPHFDHSLEELGLLAKTAGFAVADRVTCKRKAPDPALFVGSGKAEEIRMLAQATGASEVLFDQALLAEGGTLDDPATFVKRINQLMMAMSGN